MGTRKLIHNVEWENSGSYFETAFLYGAKFMPGNNEIVMGGGSGGYVKMFELNGDEGYYKGVARINANLEKGILSMDVSKSGKMMVLGMGNKTIRLMNIQAEHKEH
jgi:hypothetical protein